MSEEGNLREQVVAHLNLARAILSEADADGVAQAVAEQRADANGGLDAAVLAFARFGDAEMQRVIPIRPLLRKARGEEELDSMQFLKLVRQKLAVLHLKDELLHRGVNEGFSGGEKKRNEIFQLAVLEPKLAILDETDSGLDIDALKSVADGVNALRAADRSFLVITHYQRLLDYIKPDVVHVLADGRIVKSGGPELALELEAHGYDFLKDRVVPEAAV